MTAIVISTIFSAGLLIADTWQKDTVPPPLQAPMGHVFFTSTGQLGQMGDGKQGINDTLEITLSHLPQTAYAVEELHMYPFCTRSPSFTVCYLILLL